MVVEYKHTHRYSQTQTHPALSVLLLSIYYLLLLMLFWVVAMVSLLCLFFLPVFVSAGDQTDSVSFLSPSVNSTS